MSNFDWRPAINQSFCLTKTFKPTLSSHISLPSGSPQVLEGLNLSPVQLVQLSLVHLNENAVEWTLTRTLGILRTAEAFVFIQISHLPRPMPKIRCFFSYVSLFSKNDDTTLKRVWFSKPGTSSPFFTQLNQNLV